MGSPNSDDILEWEEAYNNLRESLGLPTDEPVPKMPRREIMSTSLLVSTDTTNPSLDAKRKATDEDKSSDKTEIEPSKRSKADATPTAVSVNGASNGKEDADSILRAATAVAAFIPFLSPEDLLPPKMPSREEVENVLLKLRKKALVEEYFGE